jgi:hypothetical protein
MGSRAVLIQEVDFDTAQSSSGRLGRRGAGNNSADRYEAL